MNEIFFSAGKNGQTCSVNGILLHSRYDPKKEAERFVGLIQTDFEPQCVMITGPALSHCLPFLRERFPHARLAAVQYSIIFSQTDNQWDTVFYSNSPSLAEDLYAVIGEEIWGNTLFISWKPSETAFPQDFAKTWQAIKDASVKCRNVLSTRVYFNIRWIKNSVHFCLKVLKTAQIVKGNMPVLIAASGQSLTEALPSIKKYRNSFFILALSSAVLPLFQNDIIPDLIITTDGGYWAKVHLNALEREPHIRGIPVAATLESALTSSLFKNNPIVPLVYGDGADLPLAHLCGLPHTVAKRNGTVSGTAAELALSLTDSFVFFCGLDLADNPTGYAHTQPNALESTSAVCDFRFEPLETRHTVKFTQKTALKIYAAWFSSRNADFMSRVFRIKTKTDYSRSLLPLRDIEWDEVLQKIATAGKQKTLIAESPALPVEKRRGMLRNYLKTEKARVSKELAAVRTRTDMTDKTIFWLKTAGLGNFLQFERGKITAAVLAEGCDSFFDQLIGETDPHERENQ